ncbi:hypothetical protein RN001_002993 [Aquatica leii]|uniref:Uncharacterized protein n=1 Tax=Aquatica leii TaxID=1421715 RepID=A0AAN7PHN1_9COLE|nr:hypothetical protein RN001_002993 [Aquatica leii]
MQHLKNIITTDHIPDEKTIRNRLIDRYHDDVIISCNQKCDNKKEDKFRILKTASEVIRRDIRSQVYDNENYSPSDSILQQIDKSIPESLNFLLSEIILSDKKRRVATIPTYEKNTAPMIQINEIEEDI